MRVFLIRLSQRRWTLYSEKSEYIASKASLSVEAATSGDVATDRILNNSSSNRVLDKIKDVVTYTKTKAVESRKEIDAAQDGVGVKGKLKQMLLYLESKIHPEEAILQQFSIINPKKYIKSIEQQSIIIDSQQNNNNNNDKCCPIFHVYYPSNLGLRRAYRYSGVVIRQRASYHKFWSVMHLMMMPFTIAATILPGPNVFLAYNIYRLYSHLMAVKGTMNFREILNNHRHDMFVASDELMEYDNNHHFQDPISSSSSSSPSTPSHLSSQSPQKHHHHHHTILHIHQPKFKLHNDLIERLSTRVQTPNLMGHIKSIEENEKKQLIH